MTAVRKLVWIAAVLLIPVFLVAAILCSLLSGSVDHNRSAIDLCFHGGELSAQIPDEYAGYIEEMQDSFTLLDASIKTVNEMIESDETLDETRIKALFYALYFGEDGPSKRAHRKFVDCFVTYEERTEIIAQEDGTAVETTYLVAILIEDLEVIHDRIRQTMGVPLNDEQLENAERIYNLVRYGVPSGLPSDEDAPLLGANGFCSPIGSGWERRVTSEFGNRIDPFTGKRKGHSGMDLAVPTGTAVHAARSGTVTASQYNTGGYGYYVMIDHGDGLSTLYGHCSQLLVRVGQRVQTGDVIALSGSTGRSTGPHLHFEVRINGERTNPRAYLPTT